MKDVKIISVNPGKTTDIAKNYQFLEKMARTCSSVTKAVGIPKRINFCNSIFGINKSATNTGSTKLLLVRTLVAAYFVTIGIISLLNSWSPAIQFTAIFSIVLGGMLFLGFFSRIASIAGVIVFGYISTYSIFHFPNIFPITAVNVSYTTSLAQTLICIIMAVTGPGKYCIDQLIRKSILRASRRHARRKTTDEASSRLSYRAWQAQ